MNFLRGIILEPQISSLKLRHPFCSKPSLMRPYFIVLILFIMTACGDEITTCSLQENHGLITNGSLAMDSSCQFIGAIERFPDNDFHGEPGVGDNGTPCDFRNDENC